MKVIAFAKSLTWVGWLNFLVLQWFFIRLVRVCDMETGETTDWTGFGPVLPLTGWWSKYRMIQLPFI